MRNIYFINVNIQLIRNEIFEYQYKIKVTRVFVVNVETNTIKQIKVLYIISSRFCKKCVQKLKEFYMCAPSAYISATFSDL